MTRSLAIAAITLIAILVTAPGPAHAQTDLASFAVLGGQSVTNATDGGTNTVITGNVGVSPGTSITGFFPPDSGIVIGVTYNNTSEAAAAQAELTTLYTVLAGSPMTADLSGQNLGVMTLTPGTYFFNTDADLTGTLTLDFQNDPNAIFIFNIERDLLVASGGVVEIDNGADELAGNVFWRVGRTAVLGSDSEFMGQIAALTSITMGADASIICGAAWARNAEVTLIDNVITACENTLSATEVAAVIAELSGETGTGVVPTGTQAMDSFLSLLGSRFSDSLLPGDDRLPDDDDDVIRALGYGEEQEPFGSAAFASFNNTKPAPRRWSVWLAGYGSYNETAGDGLMTHDRSSDSLGVALGLDYRVSPDTRVGIAIGSGGTSFSLSDDLGNGSSTMVQLGIHGRTNLDAAYFAGAMAFAWHDVNTVRSITVGEGDTFTANFSAHNVAGQIEAGYRFGAFVPYAALRAQSFYTPAYSEMSASGDLDLALAYEDNTTTTLRTELGARINPTFALDDGATLTVRAGAAWAHNYGDPQILIAAFQTMPVGPSFTVSGATQPRDSLLVTAGAEVAFKGGLSVAGVFDGEFAEGYQTYAGSGRVRYAW